MSFNKIRQMVMGTIWQCESYHTNCMFHTLREVGAERKVIHLRYTGVVRLLLLLGPFT